MPVARQFTVTIHFEELLATDSLFHLCANITILCIVELLYLDIVFFIGILITGKYIKYRYR